MGGDLLKVLAQTREYYAFRLRRLPYKVISRFIRRRSWVYERIEQHFEGKCGLEIGGPSQIFERDQLIPIYPKAQIIDECNFSKQTIWNSDEKRETAWKAGKRFVSEACDLSGIADGAYDFVLASHVLEHVANPLRALGEWSRVLKDGGTLLAVVPHKEGTFDHRRPFTPFAHIVADFEAGTGEDDTTHLEEILSYHDLLLDRGAGSLTKFRERCARNAEVRALHHHVFSPKTLVSMLDFGSMRVLQLAVERPYHIIALAQKVPSQQKAEAHSHNLNLVADDSEWVRRDPFKNYLSKSSY